MLLFHLHTLPWSEHALCVQMLGGAMYFHGGTGANIDIRSTNFVRNMVTEFSDGVRACFSMDTDNLTYLQGQDKLCSVGGAMAGWRRRLGNSESRPDCL